MGGEAGAGIGDGEEEVLGSELGLEGDGTGLGRGFDAMADGIFEEGLEEEGGDGGGEAILGDGFGDGEAVAEADFFDIEVTSGEVEFLLKSGFGGIGGGEGEAEEIGEAGEHFIGGFGVAMDEGGDGVEGIEEEVGVELHAEGLESGLGELAGEGASVAFAIAEAGLLGEPMPDTDDEGVGGEEERESGGEVELEAFLEGGGAEGTGGWAAAFRGAIELGRREFGGWCLGFGGGSVLLRRAGRAADTDVADLVGEEVGGEGGMGGGVEGGGEEAGAEVGGEVPGPTSGIQRAIAGEEEDGRHEGGPEPGLEEAGPESGGPGDGLIEAGGDEDDLTGENAAEEGGDEGDDGQGPDAEAWMDVGSGGRIRGRRHEGRVSDGEVWASLGGWRGVGPGWMGVERGRREGDRFRG